MSPTPPQRHLEPPSPADRRNGAGWPRLSPTNSCWRPRGRSLTFPGAVLHVHDAGEAEAVVRAPGNGTAVLLPAVSEDTVWELATAGVMLPRKSTSFGPKPVAGLALRVFDAAE